MNFKKLLKVISAIVAVAGVIAAVYIAIQKLTAHKEPEYFDDNDFFECDNEIEIVEAKAEEAKEEPKEEKKAPAKKPAAKRTTAKKAVEPKMEVHFQFAGKDILAKSVLDQAVEAYKSTHKDVEIKKVELYIVAEEGAAYYVVNGIGADDYKIEL